MLKRTYKQLRLMVAALLTGALLARILSPGHTTRRHSKSAAAAGQSPTAQSIARDLLAQNLEQDELFDAMWAWQYDTGIEPFTIYQEYKKLREQQPTD